MRYLLDTNHWSYIQRRHPGVIAHIQRLPETAMLYMPVVAQAELLMGIQLIPSPRRRSELQALYEEAVMMATEILPITTPVAEQFAQIAGDLRRRGQPIPTNDLWIAAIAMAHNLILVTRATHTSG
ncbi:tRNA(fMet)-specific endonuclease VapC [Armatimonadetes bacterium GXS]|nr:tRNA(fMet)-specific endonuclease VapC [Armatimonadetes bacterium GXS]